MLFATYQHGSGYLWLLKLKLTSVLPAYLNGDYLKGDKSALLMQHRFPSVPAHDASLILQSYFRTGQQERKRKKKKKKGEEERERERDLGWPVKALMESQETGATGGRAAACCTRVPPM